MSTWYEVFDNEHVQFLTRKRVFQLTIVLVLAGSLSFALVFYLITNPSEALVSLFLIGLIWAGPVSWIAYRLQQIRRVMWCIKMSDREIVGYDHARRKTALDWLDVDHIAINDRDISLVGKEREVLEIPHLYPDFASLSHRILEHADFYDIPIHIDGKPWEELDIREIYPFIEKDPSTEP